MSNKIKSLIFDLLQVSSIVFVLLTGPIIASNSFLFLLQILSILILFEAAWEMRKTKYYRVPDIGKQNELVRNGIYKYIRNPMYLSQLFFCGILILNSYTIERLIVYFIFLLNFVFKIKYEENLLHSYFKEFAEYKKTSWKLIPFIY